MAYTVLARRYRSTTFDEVVGQSHVAQTVKKAIASGRIAHAYLFCGTRGTGKTSMARILAKALNCQSAAGPVTEPCNTCDSCLGIARGEDMDYIEIDAASNTGVDNVRDVIIGNSAYRPARCRFKIFLVDEVHMLSKGAFNALLKTLEEPPEHVKFILATTEPEKIPNTILSRCQRYDFKNIPTREVAGHLGAVCKAEGIDAEDDALLLVARAGGGSMRDSLSLLDRLLSVGEKKLTLGAIEALLGLPRAEQVAAMVEAIGNGDPGAALKAADDVLSSGMSPDSLIAATVDHLHNLLLIRVCGEKTELVDAPGVRPEVLAGQAGKIDTVLLVQDIAVLEELRRQLRTGAGGRALFDATVVRLALAEQFRAISEVVAGGGSVGAGGDEKKKPLAGGETLGGGGYGPSRDARPAEGTLSHAGGIAPRADVQDARPFGAAGGIAPAGGPAEGSLDGPASVPAVSVPPVSGPAVSGPAVSEPAVAVSTGDVPDGAAAPRRVTPPAATFTPAGSDEDDDLPRPGKVWDNSGPSLAEMLKRHATGGSSADASPVGAGPHTAPPEPPNVEAVDERALPSVWKEVLEQFRQREKGLYALVEHAEVGSVSGGQVVLKLGAGQGHVPKLLETLGRKEKITTALSAALGQQVGLKLEVAAAPTTPAPSVPPPVQAARVAKPSRAEIEEMARRMGDGPPEALAAAAMPGAASNVVKVTPEMEEELKQDELLKAVMETLGAQIVKVTEE